MGAVTLREFALALLVGLITGSYSSIFIATPLLAMLKSTSRATSRSPTPHATGAELERLVLGGTVADARQRDPDRCAPRCRRRSVAPGAPRQPAPARR